MKSDVGVYEKYYHGTKRCLVTCPKSQQFEIHDVVQFYWISCSPILFKKAKIALKFSSKTQADKTELQMNRT